MKGSKEPEKAAKRQCKKIWGVDKKKGESGLYTSLKKIFSSFR